MDDWGMSNTYIRVWNWLVDIDEPTSGTSTPPAPVLPKPSARSKWQDEDKEESEEVGLSSCYRLSALSFSSVWEGV